ncbi:Condensation domain-containing protein [Selenomonas sp. GACV-9]|uniref:condensation domain-containing protein n=1 Tax=Selenomonas sp. GACV-9 TaxID=3158782 RepID=UPI0008F16A31|nr:Condensation domain-containing protein [Selenomonas ruminantium]
MNVRKWDVAELPAEQQEILRQLYGAQVDERWGYSANRIEYVRELTEGEQQVLSQGEAAIPVSPLRQILYKFQGSLLPLRFNLAIRTLTEHEDILRLNFCCVGREMRAIVFKERRDLPEIMYRNLEKLTGQDLDDNLRRLMEADLRQGFDLRHGSLLRFAVYHTGVEEYAVVVTGVQAVIASFNVSNIFRALRNMPLEKAAVPPVGTVRLAEPIRKYWSQLLSELPPPARIPYCVNKPAVLAAGKQGRMQSYLTHIPGDVLSELRKLSKDNKMVLLSILQTAWGLLLQGENECQDVAFCLLAPSRNGARGSQSLLPFRLRVEGEPAVQEIVNQVLKQFRVAHSYAALGREDIRAIMGQDETDFDHVLNFSDFFQEEAGYSQRQGNADGNIVTQEVVDIRDMCLGLRFRYGEKEIAITFAYNSLYFTPEGIGKLAQDYGQILRQMLTDWHLDYRKFMENWQEHSRQKPAEYAFVRMELLDALSRLQLLQSCEKGLVQSFAGTAKLLPCYEGDRFIGKDVDEQFLFVVRGKVARSIETGDGWYNTLDILAENSWVNEMILLPERKINLALEILTEQAMLLAVPRITMESILRKEPAVAQSVIQHLCRQMEKYQRLWVQS